MSTSNSQAIMAHQYLSAIPSIPTTQEPLAIPLIQTTQVRSRFKHIAPRYKTPQFRYLSAIPSIQTTQELSAIQSIQTTQELSAIQSIQTTQELSATQSIQTTQELSTIPSIQTAQVQSRSKHIVPDRKTLYLPPEIWYRIITHFADYYTLSTLRKTCRTFRAFLDPLSASFSHIHRDSWHRTHESWLSLKSRANVILVEICLDIKLIGFTEYRDNFSYRALSRQGSSAFEIYKEWLGKKFIRKLLDHINEGEEHTRGDFFRSRCVFFHEHGIFKCRLGKKLCIERASEELLIECGMDMNSEDVKKILELLGACERYWGMRDSKLRNYLTRRVRDGVLLYGRDELERIIELERTNAIVGAAE